MTITVDDREPAEAVLRSLHADGRAQVRVARLPLGDYLVDGHLLFERKTLTDFAISLCDGRLFKQAIAMANGRLQPYMILEDNTGGPDAATRVAASTSERPSRGVPRDAILGAIVTLGVVLGIPVLPTNSPDETARILIFAGEQRARRAAGAVSRPGYRPKGLRKRQLFVLQGLPGVGRKRAEALLDRFHTPAAILAAPEEDLARVDGIGINTARALRRIAHVDASAESAGL